MKKGIQVLMAVLLIVLSGCGSEKKTSTVQPVTLQADLDKLSEGPQIVRKESFKYVTSKKIQDIKELPPSNIGGIDIRDTDVSNVDFSNVNINNLSFDSKTIWPKALPKDYDIDKVQELGKDAGLNIHALHEQGITGEGVNVAIADQGMSCDHKEYKGKVQLYELLHSYDNIAQMHGSAVASIAVGNEVGVAPGASLYYISNSHYDWDEKNMSPIENLSYMSESIHRIIEINRKLPVDNKISVLSISKGFSEKENPDVFQAIEEAKKEGIFVITPELSINYGISIAGLTRDALGDPNIPASYKNAPWQDERFLQSKDVLFVPVDHRTIAGPLSTNDYVHYSDGGISWAVPWLAGLYALCHQVDPQLTGEEFLNDAKVTGDSYDFGTVTESGHSQVIVNPEKLIQYIKDHK